MDPPSEAFAPPTGAKRPITVDKDEVSRDPKRISAQPYYESGGSNRSLLTTRVGSYALNWVKATQQNLKEGINPLLSPVEREYGTATPLLPGTISGSDIAMASLRYKDATSRARQDEQNLFPGLESGSLRAKSDFFWNVTSYDHPANIMDDYLNVDYTDFNMQEASPWSEHYSEGMEGALPTRGMDLTNLLDSTTTESSTYQASMNILTSQATGRGPDLSEQASLFEVSNEESYETKSPTLTSILTPFSDDRALYEAESKWDGLRPDCLQSTPAIVDYDTCFGVIFVDALSSFNGSQRSSLVPVTMRRFGDMIKLHYQDSSKYAGLIVTPVLGNILDNFGVKCEASLEASLPQPCQVRKQKKGKALTRQKNCSARIVMYGLKHQESAIGDMLSNSGLFLQQPSAAECDRNINYSNPHYLIRPGSRMPALDGAAMCSSTSAGTVSERLNEVTQSRLMQLFDSANVKIQRQITPSLRLRASLKDHQLSALTMMMEKECGLLEEPQFPSIWKLNLSAVGGRQYRHSVTNVVESSPTPLYGGILADDMGLGKTLSMLALICSSLDLQSSWIAESSDPTSIATLIVTPKSTIPGWQSQAERHIHPGRLGLTVYHGPSRERLHPDFKNVDVILTTYDVLRSDWINKGPLFLRKWHRVVLDEAHHIRNRSSQTFRAACAIICHYRWCLTGTPIQNSIEDYGALLSFIGVPSLTDKSMFDFWIASPIKEGKPYSLRRFQDLISATCLRRTKKMVDRSLQLPRRLERIETIELHQADRELYTYFKDITAAIAAGKSSQIASLDKYEDFKDSNILSLINFLRLICNHGKDLLPLSALAAWNKRESTSVDWQVMQNWRSRCVSCSADIGTSESINHDHIRLSCEHSICARCARQSVRGCVEEEIDCPECVLKNRSDITVSNSHVPASGLVRYSAKVEALLRNLHSERGLTYDLSSQGVPKSVIFSYWTKMLDLIQQALESEGFCMQRIDGKSSLEQRREAIKQFTCDENCTIMLASISSAGEGIDLTVANSVHLIEPHWNPMAEAQAVDRIHRIGQTRDVTVYRYIVCDSIETYIQWVQQDKLRLISRSLEVKDISQAEVDEERWNKLRSSLT